MNVDQNSPDLRRDKTYFCASHIFFEHLLHSDCFLSDRCVIDYGYRYVIYHSSRVIKIFRRLFWNIYLIRLSSTSHYLWSNRIYASVSVSVAASATTEQPGCWIEKPGRRTTEHGQRYIIHLQGVSHNLLHSRCPFSTEFWRTYQGQRNARVEI